MNAGKMFLPAAVICVFTNIVPVLQILMSAYYKVQYREIYFIMALSISVNSAVNFPVYYYRSRIFRASAQEVTQNIAQRFGIEIDFVEGKSTTQNNPASIADEQTSTTEDFRYC